MRRLFLRQKAVLVHAFIVCGPQMTVFVGLSAPKNVNLTRQQEVSHEVNC